MSKTPFFSIVIPTYNRAKFLKATIAITLLQTFEDFELIISNNCSTDNTREVVQSFKDKRIRYFENKENIGGEPNMKKVISYARGRYIFTLGDDDFILFENTLEKLKKIIDKKNYGFIRLNLVEKKFIGEGLRKSIITFENSIVIEKNTPINEMIDTFQYIASGHFAGLVFKNYSGLANDFLTFPEMAWVEILYKNTKKLGAYFAGDLYMIITWSQGDILTHYNLKKGRMMVEEFIDYVLQIIPKTERNDYKLHFYNKFIILQPVIKLYSNNKNLIIFDKRLLKVEPRLKESIFFWMLFVIAFITPKSIWKMVRVLQHKQKNTFETLPNKEKIYKKFISYNKKYFTV